MLNGEGWASSSARAHQGARLEPKIWAFRCVSLGRSFSTASTRMGWGGPPRPPQSRPGPISRVLPIGASSPKYLRAMLRVSTRPSGTLRAAVGLPARTG